MPVLVAVVPTIGLLLLAARSERERLVRDGRDQARTLAQLVAQQHQRSVDAARGLLLGVSRMRSVREQDGARCSASLAPLLAEPWIANVGAATAGGQVFCAATPLTGPVSLSDRSNFEGALRTGQMASGTYVISRLRKGVGVLSFAIPVRGPEGTARSIAFSSLAVDGLQRQLDQIPVPAGATVAVVDRVGVTLTARPGGSGAGTPHDPRLLDRLVDGAQPLDLDGPDGVRRVYAAEPVVMPSGELVLRVVVGLPAAAAYGSANLVFGRTLLAFLGVALCALAGAAFVGERFLVRRIRALSSAAGRIARGESSARSGTRAGDDELGDLIRAFDRMAESLESLTRQNQMLLDSVGEGILGTDREGTIVFANPAAARALGRTPEEMVGQDAHSLVHPRRPDGQPSPREGCLLQLAMREAIVKHVGDQRFWRKDGSSFPVEFVSTPMRDGAQVVGAVLAFRDVSDRQQLEEQLRQAQKMEAIGQLAGGVAHDFNNLLTAILTCGRFLQEELGAAHPSRADVDMIVATGQRAAALTRQLLAVARRQQLDPRPFTLAEAVRGMEGMLRRVLGEAIALEVDLEAPGAVRADLAQLEQVVLNLVVNARDAMPDGGRLTLSVDELAAWGPGRPTEPGLPAGPLARLRVRDTGVGMSPETQARIFEPFFSTKGPSRGTGLGLSMVYGIVTQSGGALRVQSAPGQGTEVAIYLPWHAGPPASAAAGARREPVPGGAETVLLVEDDDAIRSLARRTLAAAGFTVLDAGSPSEALARARGHAGPLHLLLSDVILPQQNGWELSRSLVAERPAIRVLFMSGYAGNRLDGEAILPPDAPLLAKPFTPEELLRRVREAIGV